MKILIDVVHPAHVHFFKNILRSLQNRGHTTYVVARKKDVTLNLLDAYDIPHISVGAAVDRNRISQARELISRVAALHKIGKNIGADWILTRNPAGVIAARLLGIKGVFDTDDGKAAGIHCLAAMPFANYITTPVFLKESFGSKHRAYQGFKQAAYLHPDHFTPDPIVLDELGLATGEPFFLVRFVAMAAAHDHHESGLDSTSKSEVIKLLQKYGRVFLSSESELPESLKPFELHVSPEKMHHVLAQAHMLVGDSQTMAAEAAYLGIPNVRISSWAGRLAVLSEFEEHYRLSKAFQPKESMAFLEYIEDMASRSDLFGLYQQRRELMLAETCNVADWYVQSIENGFEVS